MAGPGSGRAAGVGGGRRAPGELPDHGPTVIQVPWARHGAGHTRAFDDTVAWLAVQCSKTAVTELMRIAWRTVGSIVARVTSRHRRRRGPPRPGCVGSGSTRSPTSGAQVPDRGGRSRYGPAGVGGAGRDEATLERFFDALGAERCARISHVSADAADWIARVVARRCPQAVQCADPFHVVNWATDALDEVRRQAWNEARGGQNQPRSERRHRHPRSAPAQEGPLGPVEEPRGPHRPATPQAGLDRPDPPPPHRAYLLKEGLRVVFKLKGDPSQRRPRSLDLLGPPLPHPRLRPTRNEHRPATAPRSTPPSTPACPTR